MSCLTRGDRTLIFRYGYLYTRVDYLPSSAIAAALFKNIATPEVTIFQILYLYQSVNGNLIYRHVSQ